jgi:hypothetical protein
MKGKVIRVHDEAYARLLQVSRAYGLTIPQAANLFILGRVGPSIDGKFKEMLFPSPKREKPHREGLKCPQCKGMLELARSAPGLYMLRCPICCESAGQ